jgi:hypothetical protein
MVCLVRERGNGGEEVKGEIIVVEKRRGDMLKK